MLGRVIYFFVTVAGVASELFDALAYGYCRLRSAIKGTSAVSLTAPYFGFVMHTDNCIMYSRRLLAARSNRLIRVARMALNIKYDSIYICSLLKVNVNVNRY